MADWIKVHGLNETRDGIIPTLVQELGLQSLAPFEPEKFDPNDFRVVLGIQSVLRFHNGSLLFVTDSPARLASLLAAKE